jgi:hypothetical protein
MFFKQNSLKDKIPRLYILDITMPSGMKCVKIGVSSGSNSVDRMMQVNRDIFNKYRCTAMIRIHKDKALDSREEAFRLESMLHRFFKDYRYTPAKAFDGSTELFCIDVRAAKDALDFTLDGNNLDEYTYEPLDYEEDLDSLPF